MQYNEKDREKIIPIAVALIELEKMDGWKYIEQEYLGKDIEKLTSLVCNPAITDEKQTLIAKGELKYARELRDEISRIKQIYFKIKEAE